MGILIEKKTKVLVQGITGKEGRKATGAMIGYHTKVVAGVRPGKGGEQVAGVPVFDSVKEAIERIPDIGTAAIYVPPLAVKQAVTEALQVDSDIKIINIMAERVPIQDSAYCLAMAGEKDVRIIGPGSLGYITPGIGRVGVVGGPLVNKVFRPGPVGVISRSGGMTNELSWQVRKHGLGQSTAVHVGGDLLIGTSYADLLIMFEQDEQTKAVVVFAEYGGGYEFEISELIEQKRFNKPIAIYIGGKFANLLPEGMNIGHAGAIVEKGKGAAEKEKALKRVGVMVADNYEQLVYLVKEKILL